MDWIGFDRIGLSLSELQWVRLDLSGFGSSEVSGLYI